MDTNTILNYLKSKIPNFVSEVSKNKIIFTCPNFQNHVYDNGNPTATVINGTDKINCLACDFTGNLFDLVRLLEEDKSEWDDCRITAYLLDKQNSDVYCELKEYEKYGWYLFPLEKNSKNPKSGESWKENSTNDRILWIKWLEQGYNIALDCGKSKVLAIDVDTYKPIADEELKKKQKEYLDLLQSSKTLMQNSSSGGIHFIFNLSEGFKNWANLGNLFIDIRTEGGQLVLQPTKIYNKNYHFINLGSKIKDLSEELKNKLLELPKNKLETVKRELVEVPKVETIAQGEGRNVTLTSICGIVANKFKEKPETVEWLLHLVNQKFCNPPLPTHEVKTIVSSITGYKSNEKLTQKEQVLQFLQQMNIPCSAKDVLQGTENPKLTTALVNKYFSELAKDGLIIHWNRGSYKIKEQLEWTDTPTEQGKLYQYKIPFFNHIMDFANGDLLLLGGLPGSGKTHVGMNMLSQMIAQGCKPYYVSLESGSRYGKIAEKLGLIENGKYKFYVKEHNNPLNISIEPNSFTIIDWLNVNDFEKTAQIHEYYKNEMQVKQGVLVMFAQLKKSEGKEYTFFAENLADQFPSFTAIYSHDNNERTEGHWTVRKIRDPKGGYYNARIDCTFDPTTKLFRTKEE